MREGDESQHNPRGVEGCALLDDQVELVKLVLFVFLRRIVHIYSSWMMVLFVCLPMDEERTRFIGKR